MATQQNKKTNGETEAEKKKRLQQEAIDKARSSGSSSVKTSQADSSANANIYYRGYDKSGKEVRVRAEDMPQNADDKTKLAWQKGVTSFTKVTEASANTTKPQSRDIPLAPTPEPKNKNYVREGNWSDELKKERFKFKS